MMISEKGCGVCTCAQKGMKDRCHVWPVYAAVALVSVTGGNGGEWREEVYRSKREASDVV